MGRVRTSQNTPAVLAVLSGLILAMTIGYAWNHWNIYNAISGNLEKADGKIIDMGDRDSGVTYEFEYLGKTYRGSDIRSAAFGLYVGASKEVVFCKTNPEISTTNLELVRARAVGFTWASLVCAIIVGCLTYFGIRQRGEAPTEVQVPSKTRESVVVAIFYLSVFSGVMTGCSIAISQFAGEGGFLAQAVSVVNRPDIGDDKKVETIRRSLVVRYERDLEMRRATLGILGASFVMLFVAGAILKRQRIARGSDGAGT